MQPADARRYLQLRVDVINEALRSNKHPFRQVNDRPAKAKKNRYERRKIREYIRLGDWVEINGVVGEVIEIGLLRTVLLETGNWTDSGHPTGRKVAFVNSFAIEGHFFNFSTSGQWLWDEVQLMIPAGRDPHAVISAVQKLVIAETETDARLAEHDFQRSTSHHRVKSFSAEPAINVRPTSSGIELHVRYITRAHVRYAMRTRLYEKMVDLLHGTEAALKN